MSRAWASGWWTGPLAFGLLAFGLLGCEPEPAACEEDPRAQVLDERVELTLAGAPLTAELADEALERERGWMHRVCAREALLMTLPDPAPLPVWGCALSSAIDAVFVADGVIVAIEPIEPCPEPCGACPSYGEGLEVEAVLELPAGDAEGLALGDPVLW